MDVYQFWESHLRAAVETYLERQRKWSWGNWEAGVLNTPMLLFLFGVGPVVPEQERLGSHGPPTVSKWMSLACPLFTRVDPVLSPPLPHEAPPTTQASS